MKKVLVMTFTFMSFSSLAYFADQKEFKNKYVAQYPNAANIAKCNLCHGDKTLNPYGEDYLKADFNFAVIEEIDSDGDGVSNIEEIKAGTNPGI